jgi:hypothetical protein
MREVLLILAVILVAFALYKSYSIWKYKQVVKHFKEISLQVRKDVAGFGNNLLQNSTKNQSYLLDALATGPLTEIVQYFERWGIQVPSNGIVRIDQLRCTNLVNEIDTKVLEWAYGRYLLLRDAADVPNCFQAIALNPLNVRPYF